MYSLVLLFRDSLFLLGLEEASHAIEAAGLAEDNHAFEQRRRHGAAGDDGAEEHEVFFDRPCFFLAQLLKGRFKRRRRPLCRFKHGKLFRGEDERLLQRALLWNDDFGRWKNVVGEEEVRQIAKFAQRLNPGLHKCSDLAEIVVTKNGGPQRSVKVFRRQSPEILSVEPPQLCQVEDWATKANILYLEAFHHLFQRKLLSDRPCAFRHAAAHQAEEVDHSLGQEAGLAIINQRNRVLALRDLRLVQIAQQRHVP